MLRGPLSYASLARWLGYSGTLSGRAWFTPSRAGRRARLVAALPTLRSPRHWTSPQQYRERIALAVDRELRSRDDAVRSLAQRLLLGVSERDELQRAHVRLGLAHLLAVSGLHVLIVAALLARAVASLPRRSRAIAFCAAIVAYAWLAGARPPIVRASVAALLWFVARERGQALSWASVLAVAAMVTAATDPRALTSASFCFSYAAVLGIAWLAPSLRESMARVLPKHPRIVEGLSVSTGAWLMTAPLSLEFFGTTSFWGIVWTPLAMPWIASLLLCGILGLVLLPFGFGGPAFDAFASIAETYFAFLELGSGLPAAPMHAARILPAGSTAMLYGIGLPIALSLASRKLLVSLLGLGIVVSLVPAPAPAREPSKQRVARNHRVDTVTRVRVLDVGHGLSVLITSPARSVVVDCGALAGGERAAQRLLGSLRELGRARIDDFVLTHGDQDHWNGLAHVLVHVPIGRAILLEGAGTAAAERELRDAGVDCELMAPGSRRELLGGQCVVHAALEDADLAGDNESSLLVLLHPCECESLAICSDQEDAGLRAAIARVDGSSLLARTRFTRPRLGAIVLPHHGSFGPGMRAWLDAFRPRLCIASTSSSRGVAAPWSDDALRLFEPWSTAEHGDIDLVVGRGRWRLQTAR